jgi:hypothetical protein
MATAWCVSPEGFALAYGDAAKELAKLEERYDATELDWQEAYKVFRPEYEAFAKKHAGTEEALTAKLRVLKFVCLKENEAAERVAAGVLLDEILEEYPRSPQLGRLPALFYLFTDEKFEELVRKLDAPDQPDEVKAALALFRAKGYVERKEWDKARPYLDLLLGKYKAVPDGYTTCGEIADALRSPHSESALEIGASAPEIVGKDVEGKPLKLSDLKGSVVVIDFFGDW